MKPLCYSRYILPLLLACSSLFGSLNDKSAMLYYGEKISYPMVGIHDYIIVQPANTNTNTHGFSVYKDKMYAYVSIGEIDTNIEEYKKVKEEWILGENTAWKSKVLDLGNLEYQDFFFKEMIEPQMKRGFKHFFFDTLDSYQIVAKTDAQRAKSEIALASMINNFHKKYPDSKLIVNRGFEIIDKIHTSIEAVLFESYYYGVGGENLGYKKVSDSDREWLDIHLDKIKAYNIDIIAVDYLELLEMDKADKAISKIKAKGMIPYVATVDLNTYGKSSKNALKRQVLCLIDESDADRISSLPHRLAALPLEYLGYVQKLHEVNKEGLPELHNMTQYAGVTICLSNYYSKPEELIDWVLKLDALGIKVLFMENFGSPASKVHLEKLGIQVFDSKSENTHYKIIKKSDIIGFEIDPPMSHNINFKISEGEELLTFQSSENLINTTVAITKWGGYAFGQSAIRSVNNEDLWVVNPFKFFSKALGLETLMVPDVTTHNGKRLLFTHIDGDGIMNKVEWNPKLLSGDVVLEDILKTYKIPHSVSVIGGEINDEGLYPDIAKRLQKISKDMYKLDNVEAATHTYTHPFFWGQIIDDNLPLKYRLKVKNYDFSLDREIRGSLEEINKKLLSKDKPLAKSVFWTGDCAPTEVVLENIYSHDILNINGGDTYITNTSRWLSYIAPLGLERGEYYQVYTGAQNENVYTNDWLGPYWGFKKVVQTFKLTNSPRRFKPIDIYYHMYSGSKKASLNALRYAFDWSIKQDVMPIFTSEYIPKVMDFYTVSMAKEDNEWLFDGMQSLKTIRIEESGAKVQVSEGILGFNHFENHTYIHLGDEDRFIIKPVTTKIVKPYLVNSNAYVKEDKRDEHSLNFDFSGHVDLKFQLYIPPNCKVTYSSQPKSQKKENNIVHVIYKNKQKVSVNVLCR